MCLFLCFVSRPFYRSAAVLWSMGPSKTSYHSMCPGVVLRARPLSCSANCTSTQGARPKSHQRSAARPVWRWALQLRLCSSLRPFRVLGHSGIYGSQQFQAPASPSRSATCSSTSLGCSGARRSSAFGRSAFFRPSSARPLSVSARPFHRSLALAFGSYLGLSVAWLLSWPSACLHTVSPALSRS